VNPLSGWHHARRIIDLSQGLRPHATNPVLAISLLLAAVGLGMAMYLVWSATLRIGIL
jgi:hypothetical protein